ncbi:hypothetical protein [Pseudoalteromonas marina]|uniref:Uncharacterized protein n=1 Tax=Pseudoalteromonas marina TaxID=267375 RepID=A0ABT9FHV8_9GAMM|nr:hypothetical protein [Pseudoalteromonas marina]MDP2566380.1 hypothetical protein [Pseudoalteromonas marina]
MASTARGMIDVFLKSADWKFFQYIIVLRVVLLSFFTLIMMSSGVSEELVLLCLFVYLFLSTIYVSLVKQLYASFPQLTKSVSLVVASLILFAYTYVSAFSIELSALMYITAVSILVGLCDLCTSDCNLSIQNGASKLGFDSVLALSLSSFICAILIAFSYPVFGYLADLDVSFMIYFVAALLLLLPFLFNNGAGHVSENVSIYRSADKLPLGVYLQFILSPLFTVVAYMGRLYIFPLFFIAAVQSYGFDGSVFKWLGVFFAFIMLFALFSKRLVNGFSLGGEASMLFGFVSGVFSWMVIAYLYQSDHSVLNLCIATFFYMFFDITSKFWNAGYMSSLYQLAELNSKDSESININHRVYFTKHAQFSKLCIAVGFLLFYVFYGVVSPPDLMNVFCCIAIMYAVFYVFITKKKSHRLFSVRES